MIQECPSVKDAAILLEITLGIRPKSQTSGSGNATLGGLETGLVIFGDHAILLVGRVDYLSFIVPQLPGRRQKPVTGVYI
jgi:hypothetical protein